MKRKMLLLSFMLLPALTGCQGYTSEHGDKGLTPLLKESGLQKKSPAELVQEPSCVGMWAYTCWTADGQELTFRLLLEKDGQAQFQKLDAQDMLLSVSRGTWTASDNEKIELQLLLWMENGLEVSPENRRELSGIYGISFGYSESMTLSCIENAAPLVPNHQYEPVTFYNENPSPFTLNGIPRSLLKTWIYTGDNGDEISRLTLMEDGFAQMPVQDEIGNLLALCIGSWTMNGDILSLTLSQNSAYDAVFPSDWETVGGEYRYELQENGLLSLTDLDNPHPIIPNLSGGTILLESSEAAFEREMLEITVCNAVRAWYEAESGKPYSGYVTVDGWDENGFMTVHLYEDMGDHTATIGWYTVDSITMQGSDDIFGTEIDFSPYKE